MPFQRLHPQARRFLEELLPDDVLPSPADRARLEQAALAEQDYRELDPEGAKPEIKKRLLDRAIEAVEGLGNLGPAEANEAAWQWLCDLEQRRELLVRPGWWGRASAN
jgi:hypothetical protein